MCIPQTYRLYMYILEMPSMYFGLQIIPLAYGVALTSRLLKIIGPFCKRAL